MSKVSGCTMVEKPDRGDRDSSNKLVDSSSKQPSPPVPFTGTGATNTAPTQVQSPHRTGKVRPWEGVPITQSVQSPQHQALPWETASVPPSVVPYNPSGWTSEPNSPPSKRPSYLPAYNKRDSSSVFESESDSELSSMEGPSSYFSFGKNLQRSQSNISERSYSYIQDQAVSTPMSMYGSVEQLYSGGYPYSSLASPLCNSTSSIPSSVASMDIYYPPYSVSSGYPVSSAGYSPMCQNMYHPYWMCYSCRKPKIGSSTVAIDNKIEQAMDLVKSHLMYAVREEVEVLKEQIKELIEKNSQLEHKNNILKAAASPETLTLLSQPRQPPPPSSSS